MFGRVPKIAAPFLGTRSNISKSHSEIRTRVPFCIVAGQGERSGLGERPTVHGGMGRGRHDLVRGGIGWAGASGLVLCDYDESP